jgi:hypothetical protein
MLPTEHHIRQEAYRRWEEGGCIHGFALDDWVGAEQDLMLRTNYKLVAQYMLDEQQKRYIGSKTKRKCRYCGAQPAAMFRIEAHAIPEFIGNKSLIANDECDACNVFFSETVEDSLGKLLSPVRTVLAIPGKKGVPIQSSSDNDFRMEYDKKWPGYRVKNTASIPVMHYNAIEGMISADLPTQPYVPVRVLKCLAKMALAIMPEPDLSSCKCALDWIRCDDDEHQLNAIREGLTFFSFVPILFPHPVAELYKRTTTDIPMPAYIFVVGVASLLLQSYVPLCSEDDRYSGQTMITPRLGHVALQPEGPTQWDVIPVRSAVAVKDGALQVQYANRH